MKKTVIWMVVLVAALFMFTGCEDEVGAPVAPSGLSGLEIAEKITEEWAMTGKVYATPSVVSRENPASCVHCHDGATFAAGMTGELVGSYFTGIDCAACHTGVGAEFIENGNVDASLPYFRGSFIKESFKTDDSSALCIACHNGRRDPDTALARFTAGEAAFAYPHYGPAALTTGKGGMHLPGVSYSVSPVHTDMSCVGCHMPKTKDGYVSHTFAAAVEDCQSCHPSAVDFNYNGFQAKVKANLDVVYDAAFAASGATRVVTGGGAGFAFYNAADELIEPKPENIDPEVFAALYNWYLVKSDGSYGVHNPVYTKSLLNESYKAVTGSQLEW